VLEAIDDPRNTQAALFNNLLVVASKDVLQDWHDIANYGKRVMRYVSATVRRRRDGCSLCASSKEV
jgi:hypothetical protein